MFFPLWQNFTINIIDFPLFLCLEKSAFLSWRLSVNEQRFAGRGMLKLLSFSAAYHSVLAITTVMFWCHKVYIYTLIANTFIGFPAFRQANLLIFFTRLSIGVF